MAEAHDLETRVVHQRDIFLPLRRIGIVRMIIRADAKLLGFGGWRQAE